MAVGRISGPLLKENLLRNGVNLAFETNLLYLDVVNSRVGIKTASPAYDLDVAGTTRSTNLYASTQAVLGNITISGNTISGTGNITITPGGGSPSVIVTTAGIGNLQLSGNTLSSTNTNGAINIAANGTGVINLNSSVEVNGSLHATGTITADGNITLGDAVTDTISFAGEINSNILPLTTNTYNLGSASLTWANVYTTNLSTSSVSATTITTSTFQTTGGSTLDISGNTISALSLNTDINFNTTGTGGIVFGNLKFTNNTITNVVANAVTQFVQTPTNAVVTGTVATGTAISLAGNVSATTLTVTSVPFYPAGGNVTFNGTNQFFSLSPGVTIGSTSYTVELFFYMTAGTTAYLLGSSTNYGFTLKINALTGSNNISVIPFNQTANNYTVGTINLNQWNHIAITRNSGGVETVFFNGTRSSTGTLATNYTFVGQTTLIGQQGSANYFTGSITNVKMSAGANYYDPTQTTITVPTTALTSNANTRLLLPNLVPSAITTDSTGLQSVTNNNSATFGARTPFQAGIPTIIIGMQVSGSGISTGSYITSNISGTSTGSSSSWGVNLTSAATGPITITATPVVMNITGVTSGTLSVGMTLTGTGITAGTTLTSLGTGSGATGTYYVIPAQTQASSTSITGSVSGWVQFSGTGGVVVPVGTNGNRPSTLNAEPGMVRYNTEQQYVEVYNGSSWSSVAGSSTGVTTAVANSLGAGLALALG